MGGEGGGGGSAKEPGLGGLCLAHHKLYVLMASSSGSDGRMAGLQHANSNMLCCDNDR